jgi:hypothetical protein
MDSCNEGNYEIQHTFLCIELLNLNKVFTVISYHQSINILNKKHSTVYYYTLYYFLGYLIFFSQKIEKRHRVIRTHTFVCRIQPLLYVYTCVVDSSTKNNKETGSELYTNLYLDGTCQQPSITTSHIIWTLDSRISIEFCRQSMQSRQNGSQIERRTNLRHLRGCRGL